MNSHKLKRLKLRSVTCGCGKLKLSAALRNVGVLLSTVDNHLEGVPGVGIKKLVSNLEGINALGCFLTLRNKFVEAEMIIYDLVCRIDDNSDSVPSLRIKASTCGICTNFDGIVNLLISITLNSVVGLFTSQT
jgi:hypothetical protein